MSSSGLLIFNITVSGKYSGSYRFKPRFVGYDVYEEKQRLLKVRNNVEFNGEKIGKYPRLGYVIMKGYFGKFSSDQGMYSISDSNNKSLNLYLDDNQIGSIEYMRNDFMLLFKDNGSMPFPYQLTFACALYEFICLRN